MSYKVLLEKKAERELYRLPRKESQLLSETLDALESDPRPQGARKLLVKGGYRLRKGRYRILHTIDDAAKVVCVYRIGHRREVYR